MANETRNQGQQPQRQAEPPMQKNDRGQSVAPAAPTTPVTPQTSRTALTWLEEAEQYLTGKGWRRWGVNPKGQTLWDDPLGGKGIEVVGPERRLPSARKEGGQATIVRQLEVPLRKWCYPTEEALGVQRSRDEADLRKAAG